MLIDVTPSTKRRTDVAFILIPSANQQSSETNTHKSLVQRTPKALRELEGDLFPLCLIDFEKKTEP